MMISTDTQAILLLCSHLGLPANPNPSPFTLRDWNPLVRKIMSSFYKRPGALLGTSAQELKKSLKVEDEEAERILNLLDRSGTLAIELERLESLGVNVITRADPDYPSKYRVRLKESAPILLFYSGEKALLGQPGIAVVGSRHLDDIGMQCAGFVGNACGISGLVLYSGGAKGVDTISMTAALEARGTAVGILADSLERTIRNPENRTALRRHDLCLATPYAPGSGFSVGAAMGRNRLIYALADFAIIVASDAEKGGTWAGASEALKAQWLPVFVLDHPDMPEGNKLLIKKGGVNIPFPLPVQNPIDLPEWLKQHSSQVTLPPTQPKLL